jgi:hypothetical protein
MVICSEIHSVLNRWKNFFNKVLNVHGIHDVRQIDIHTTELLVPEPSLVEVEIVIGKLKKYKSLGTGQILAELIKGGCETLLPEIHNLILYGIRRNCHCSGKNLLLYQFIKRVIRLIIIEESPSYQLSTKFYPTFFWPGSLLTTMKLLGIISGGSVIIDLLPIRFSASPDTREKNGSIM